MVRCPPGRRTIERTGGGVAWRDCLAVDPDPDAGELIPCDTSGPRLRLYRVTALHTAVIWGHRDVAAGQVCATV